VYIAAESLSDRDQSRPRISDFISNHQMESGIIVPIILVKTNSSFSDGDASIWVFDGTGVITLFDMAL